MKYFTTFKKNVDKTVCTYFFDEETDKWEFEKFLLERPDLGTFLAGGAVLEEYAEALEFCLEEIEEEKET